MYTSEHSSAAEDAAANAAELKLYEELPVEASCSSSSSYLIIVIVIVVVIIIRSNEVL
jgi:hypothetical protein